jgi:hypothetical protein
MALTTETGSPDPSTSIWSAEDSPASLSALLAEDWPSETTDGSGPSSPDAFAYYDPDTSSWRTSQGSLFEEWATFSETWPLSGMTQSGQAYLRPPLVPRTFDGESSSWPTPRARDWKGAGKDCLDSAVARWPTPKVSATRNSRKALTQKHWSAPALEQAVELSMGILPREYESWDELPPVARRMWRTTPQAGEGNGGGQDQEHRKAGGHSVYLRDQVKTLEGGGSLNPTWVEWLMGFPLGWTDCAA